MDKNITQFLTRKLAKSQTRKDHKKNFFSFRFWLGLNFVYYLFISSVYAIMSLVNHSHYLTQGDLAVFNQGIWQYSRFKFPYITLHIHGSFLADHFHPILAILAPLYWFWQSEKVLLVAQPFIILSAIIPLFLVSWRLTKSWFFTGAVILAYSFYIPLQYTIFYDFHEIVFVPPLFAWSYYFYRKGKKFWTSFFLILLLLVKEEVGFFVAAYGLYLAIFDKNWRRLGLFWFGAGLVYSLAVVYWLIPAMGGKYQYFGYGSLGKTPLDVLTTLGQNPSRIYRVFFDNATKKDTLYQTFYPFGFLPLFSPLSLFLSIEQFFTRFICEEYVIRWTIAYHYSAPMAAVAALGSILTAGWLAKLFAKYRQVVLVVLAITIIWLTRLQQINRSALLLVKRPQFWARSPWMDEVDQALKMVPKDAAVAAQNNLVSHLSTRMNVYILRERERADYILVDFHPGQSAFNFLSLFEWEKTEKEIKAGIKEGKYEVVFNKGEVYLVKKKVV